MSDKPRWKIAYVPWWNPRPLAIRVPTRGDSGGFNFVGYVWRQKARLVNNINYGWIAFADEQTDELLQTCPCCKKPLVDKP